jgi:hypothetical protein
MKSRCSRLASSRRGLKLWQVVFSHARIITDPKKLAQLNSALADRRGQEGAEGKAAAGRKLSCTVSKPTR